MAHKHFSCLPWQCILDGLLCCFSFTSQLSDLTEACRSILNRYNDDCTAVCSTVKTDIMTMQYTSKNLSSQVAHSLFHRLKPKNYFCLHLWHTSFKCDGKGTLESSFHEYNNCRKQQAFSHAKYPRRNRYTIHRALVQQESSWRVKSCLCIS